MIDRARHELRLFFIALQFLTRVPVPAWVGFEPRWLNESARHFPAVGCLVGVVAAGVLWAGHALFTPAVAAGLSIAATLMLTGGFHEDGLADTCDALGGAVSRERALAIMKDSRIGAYGAMGLVTVLGLKAATLAALPLAWAVPATLLAHTGSRAAAVLLIRALPYAGDVAHAKAKPLAQTISRAGVAVALAWVVVAAGAVVVVVVVAARVAHSAPTPRAGAGAVSDAIGSPLAVSAIGVGLALVAMIAALCANLWHRRLGGYTGDTLGATQQLTELAALLGWLAVWRWATT